MPALVATPVAWFDAGRGITTVAGLVSQWNDIAVPSAPLSLVQSNALKRPTMLLSSLGTHPAVQFVAASSTHLILTNTNLFGSGAYAVVTCIQVDANVAVGGWFTNANSGANSGMSIVNVANKISVTHAGQGNHTTAADASTGVYQVWTSRRGAAAAPTLRINGVATTLTGATTTLTDPGATANLILGSYIDPTQQYGTFRVAEVIAYAANISDTQAREVEEYLYEKYGL